MDDKIFILGEDDIFSVLERLEIHINSDVNVIDSESSRFKYFDYDDGEYDKIRLCIGLPSHAMRDGDRFGVKDLYMNLSANEGDETYELVASWRDIDCSKTIDLWNELVTKNHNIKLLLNKL